ncbi:hypothetical protein XAP7430_390015 [Xanthomonas phaseoli pv. phaseoli]|uniref:Uncharacterized protein n=1 Tax=Xanthomonas campestris pv. phaseoli TaxID=317013 RepID=A0AB38E0S5_XANCH|nr:hypothetical protein XAP6984_400015 [Xanthomonas phaseoli pv. phaseoli]SON88706.1 hypothetical protein XAP7430_390015 [Xanthomonas phaseoli pv. phaseoli]
MGAAPRRLCEPATGFLMRCKATDGTGQNRPIRCRSPMTEPSEQLATLRTARMRDTHRLADACIGLLIRAVPRSNGDPPTLVTGRTQESVKPSMSSLALAVDTPQTRASGSGGVQHQGLEADTPAQRSAGRPPCDEPRCLTCSGSGAPSTRRSRISVA